MQPKTGSFAKRLYLPRVLGSAVGFCAVGAVVYSWETPLWIWVLLVFQGFVWPHIAFFRARKVAVPYEVERQNLLIESALGGVWVAAMHFNALPATMLVSMLCMNCVAVGGPKLLRSSLAVTLAFLLMCIALLKPAFAPQTSPLQVYACLPMIAVYPLVVAGAVYRLAAKLAEHKRQFRDFSRLDSPTGLLNQGAWRSAINEEFNVLKRVGGITTLALLDIDHFKAVNDGFGHLTGDEVIKLFGGVIQKLKRSTDIAGRMGGDEFGLVLRGSDEEQAKTVVARMQQMLGEAFLDRIDLPAVSLSVGVAQFSPQFDSVEHWINTCDAALYDAKRQGRNRIVAAVAV